MEVLGSLRYSEPKMTQGVVGGGQREEKHIAGFLNIPFIFV